MDALKQRLGKGVDAGAQLALARRCRRVVQDRQRAPACRPCAEIGGAPQLAVRAALRRGLGQQPFADVGVGVGAVEELQQSPALQHPRRRGSLQRLRAQQRGRHGAVGQQRAAPVGLQAQNHGGNPVGQIGMHEQAAILTQHGVRIGRGIPQQGTPQHLVEVVVVALAVGQGAVRVRGREGEDARLVGGAGIDRLAPLARRQRRIPIRHRVLARQAVGDVGVEADRVARGHVGAELLRGHVDPGAEDHPVQPVESVFQRRVEVLLVGTVEPLRRDPQLRPRVEVAERRLLPFRQCQQQARRRRPRIAAGNEHGVDPGQGGEHLPPLGEGAPYGRLVAVVGLQGGKPDPQVHVVPVGDRGHLPQHVDLRQREVVGIGGIVGGRWDHLHGVRAEDRQLAYVLLPLGDGPAAVGVGLRPVADLMAPQRIVRRRPHRPAVQQRVGQQHRGAAHLQVAQQPAHAVQHAAGVVAGDGQRVAIAVDGEALGTRRELAVPKRLRLLRRPAPARPLSGRGIAQGDHRAMPARRPHLLGAAAHLLGQHRARLPAPRPAAVVQFDPCARKVHFVAPGHT